MCLIYYNLFFQVKVGGGVNIPTLPFINMLKGKAKFHFEKNTVPPKAVTRTTRGPVYYKSVPVVYDKAQVKLKLKPGEFAGIHRAVADEFDEDHREKSEITLAFEDEESDLAGTTHSTYIFHIKIEMNIEGIKLSVFLLVQKTEIAT